MTGAEFARFAAKALRAGLVFTAIWAGAGLAAHRIASIGAETIERQAERRVAAALAAQQANWADASVDGYRVRLRGEAPNHPGRERVAALADAAAGSALGFSFRVVDETTAAPPMRAFAPAPRLRIMRGLADMAISGAAPGEEPRDRIADALAASAPGLNLIDLSRADARDPSADWIAAAQPAARIAGALLHGRLEIEANTIAVTGVAEDGPARAKVVEAANALAKIGWNVELDVSAPPTFASRLALRAEIGPGSRGLVECAAGAAGHAETIAALAGEILGEGAGDCIVATGGGANDVGEDWAVAAEATLRALAALPAGEATLRGRQARIVGGPSARRAAVAKARDDLAATLPEGFSIGPQPASPPGARSFTAALSDDGLRLSGQAPNRLLADALVSFAKAAAPGVRINDALQLDETLPGADWVADATALVSILTELREGEASLGDDWARLEGRTDDPLAIGAVHRRAAQAFGGDRAVETRLAVSPDAQASSQALPPVRCAALLTEIAASDPIRFPPGEAKIAPESAAAIDALASVLTRCVGEEPNGRIEVGGHTDSQGSEATNLSLSRARAEAVLSALIARGARLSLLTAKGYGEARPIADNGAEAGRARNRRIEFRALTDAEEENG